MPLKCLWRGTEHYTGTVTCNKLRGGAVKEKRRPPQTLEKGDTDQEKFRWSQPIPKAMEAALAATPNQSQPNARCTMGAAPQDFGDGPSSHTSQRLPDVGAGIGPTHLPLGRQLSSEGSLSGSLGCLKEGAPHRAPPPTLLIYHQCSSRICPVCGASHPWCPLGPQS